MPKRKATAKRKPKSSTGFSLKDKLFNRERVEYLAGLFSASDADFDACGFVQSTMKSLGKLELKDRIAWIAESLEPYLSDDFKTASNQIIRALPAPLDPTLRDNDFGDFIFAPLGEFVVRNGIENRHLKQSLRTLKELTKRFSMEDAIRYFINAHPDATFTELAKWARDKNYHVRRLVSEGTRPTLPWSKRLVTNTDRPLQLLDALHCDPTRYVTRSVANHLNDISKIDPAMVIDRLNQWTIVGQQDKAELDWMRRHSLRTLVKRGDSAALKLLGYRPKPKVVVDEFEILTPTVTAGDALEFACTISAQRTEPLIVDYVIDFVKANGTLAPKVHKLKQVTIEKGQSMTLQKRHVFRANATTYTLYPGTHRVTLQVNGNQLETLDFELRF